MTTPMALDVKWLANKTADILEHRGLHKGEMCKDPDDDSSPVCLLGAACAALTGRPDMAPEDNDGWELLSGLTTALKPYLGAGTVAEWNDSEYVAQGRVLWVLRKVGEPE